jgi:cytochrome c oxidase subunit 2
MTRIAALLALLSAAGAACAAPAQNALRPAGIQAERIHDLWQLTLAICALVFAAVLIALLMALWRAPRSEAATPPDVSSLSMPEPRLRRNVLLAVGASVVMLFVLIVADFQTDRLLNRMPLADAVNIEVTAHQWWWEARYNDPEPGKIFTTANELHIPVGRPVVLTLKSSDVIHTFWLPSLQGKKDMIPGRTSLLRLRADQPGTYRGQCAEFCGFEHALMAFLVTAEPNDRYEAWADAQRREASNELSAQESRGRQVFMERSCVMCHTIQGTGANATFGPDLTHLAGRQTLASGVLPNNREQLAAWITKPQQQKPGTNMPSTALSQEELDALLAYLGTLK